MPLLYQINEYITEMGKNFDSIMDSYFDTFKEKIRNMFKILENLVSDYHDDVCFMVDCDNVQAVKPRIVWVKPLGYEVNIDETKDVIEGLKNEPVNHKATHFGTYEEAKARIELETKLP